MPRRSPAQTKEAYKKRELMRVNSGRSPAERVSSATLEAEKRVLSLMSASKRLTLEAAEIISPEEFSDKVYKDMAEYMYSAAKKGEEVDPAAVINRFSGDAESENKAGEVFFNREEYTDEEKTLYDLIYKIKQDRLEAQISAEQDAKKIGELLRKKAELTEQQRTKTTNK